ncbi:MAG TPA: FecR domain-containing protein [Phycisphaerae bacterium]|jgi:hypothetical protein
MSGDEYLWEGSGEPDPEVARLERALGPLRYDRPRPEIPVRARRIRLWPMSLAAAAGLGLAFGVWSLRRAPQHTVWQISNSGKARAVSTGEWLTTDAASSLTLTAAQIGHVDLAPNTKLHLKTTKKTEHRLELAQGKITAYITAPPRLFFVETPSAVAADLGCGYSLEVDPSGDGFLHVMYGWVELQRDGRTALVPSSGQCRMRGKIGPGTPHFEDAPAELRNALDRFDFERGGATALDIILQAARLRDTLTLWHLLTRVAPPERGRVYDRLAALSAPPAGVTRDLIRQADDHALQEWKTELKKDW